LDIVQNLDEFCWRELVARHPLSNIFHTPEMFQVYARTKHHKPELWAAIDDGKPVALLLPVTISLWGGRLGSLTARTVSHGSVLYDPGDASHAALSLLLNSYKARARKATLFTELRNVCNLDGIQPFLNDCGFLYEQHLNYLIDLDRSPKALFAAIGSRTRKNIRHALNQRHITIEEAKDPGQISLCYRLISQTYSRAKVPLPDRSLFDAAFEILYPKGMVKFLIAYFGKTAVATSVELLFKDVIYGWYSGLNREYSAYLPNELLIWHILEWGATNRFKIYDFGGAGKPNQEYGVRRFKSKFGGQAVCYGRNTWVSRPGLTALSTFLYNLTRRIVF
jgi:serine/alanine adding enzyme